MLDIIIPTIILALIIHLLRILPRYSSPRSSTYRISPENTGWIVERSRKVISLYTTSLNSLPRILASRLPKSSKRLYDIGVLAGIAGGIIAIEGSLWALKEVWMAVWLEAKIHAGETTLEASDKGVNAVTRIAKRAVDSSSSTSLDLELGPAHGGLQPLVSRSAARA